MDDPRTTLRERALAHAARIISDEGLGQLSARRLAKEVGCAVGTLYNLFEDLDDIVLHVLAGAVARFGDYARSKLARHAGAPPDERLIVLANAYVDFVTENARLWRAIFQQTRPTDQHLPDWYEAVETRQFEIITDELRPLLPEMSDSDILGVAHALWAAVHGVIWLSTEGRRGGGEQGARHHIELILRAALRGLSERA